MNEHLSAPEISAWLCGEISADRAAHAGQCPLCRAEMARLEADIRGLRGAIHEWARREGGENQSAWQPARMRTGRVPRLAWTAAAAALALASAAPLYRHALERRRAAEAARARADAALMQQVDLEISRAVPGPLEPLAGFIAQPDSSTTSR